MSLELIIVRLLPHPPTDANTFTEYLKGLTVEAYDRSITSVDPANGSTGAQETFLGSASGVVTFPDLTDWQNVEQPLNIPNPASGHPKKLKDSIIQHITFFDQFGIGSAPVGLLKSVATAIIVVDVQPPGAAPAHTAANGFNIRVALKRDGFALEAPPVEWNTTHYTVSELSPFPTDYMGIAANPMIQPNFPVMATPSAYALVPAALKKLPPGTAAILLDPGGNPPPFDEVVTAVDLELSHLDPAIGGSLKTRADPLTEAQSRELASKIANNHAMFPLPPPVPPFPPAKGNPSLEDLYTSPNDDNDMTRSKFEGSLSSYHAKLDANARRLTGYIFAASAAIAAERMSAAANVALLTFPLDPRMAPSTQSQSQTLPGSSTAGTASNTNAHLSVVLTSWDATASAPPASPPLLTPDFIVPAAYFYALGHQLSTNMLPGRRYHTHLNNTPDHISDTIASAVSSGILRGSEATVTRSGAPGGNFEVNTSQAVRRLCALLPNVVNMMSGSGNTGASHNHNYPVLSMSLVTQLVTSWRDFAGSDLSFWSTSLFDGASYLDLILQIVTSGDSKLKTAIAVLPLVPPQVTPTPPNAPLNVLQHAYELPRITNELWKAFFTKGNPPPSLPDWTAPGDFASRVTAFVRRLQSLFNVAWAAPEAADTAGSQSIPVLNNEFDEFNGLGGAGNGDVLLQFLQAATSFSFDADWNGDAVDTALLATFPSAPGQESASEIRQWLKVALHVLWTLLRLTNLPAAVDITPIPLPLDPFRRFAYMEALYSRGFVSADLIVMLSVDQFIAGLTGTIIEARDIATIHSLAIALPHDFPVSGIEPSHGFAPANPGGDEALVNCIPTPSISPLGKVAYLHEMLSQSLVLLSNETSATSGTTKMETTMLDLLTARRGDIGDLHASSANLDSRVPTIDLVLESMEALGSMVASPPGSDSTTTQKSVHGAVYNTTSDPAAALLGLIGPEITSPGVEAPDPDRPGDRNPQRTQPLCIPGLPPTNELLAAIPEHSHPAIAPSQPLIYSKLQSDFTSPLLPYTRQLDLVRSYLTCAGTDRFETMRRFRKDITEFALNPAIDPPDWQAHVWRLPVRLETALEYLGLSQQEYSTLYTQQLDETAVAGLYGLQMTELWWGEKALSLSGFLEGLGLTYCEFLELKTSGFVALTAVPRRDRSAELRSTTSSSDMINHTHVDEPAATSDNPAAARQVLNALSDQDCPPCCLGRWEISFGDDIGREVKVRLLRRIAIFVRLFKKLDSGCHHQISFSRLADICAVLHLFDADGNVNTGFIRQLAALLMLIESFGLQWSDPLDHDDEGHHDQSMPAAGGSTTAAPAPPPGSARTKILTLWEPQSDQTTKNWDWAVQVLLEAVESFAVHILGCEFRDTDWSKLLTDNLEPLSRLAGFSLSQTEPSWHSDPICTIRFVEVLTKVYASRFTVGEILFLFTTQDHLDGDDPFAIAPLLETVDKPLTSLPDDEPGWDLEALRQKLLKAADAEVEAAFRQQEYDTTDWHAVQAIIRSAGFPNSAKAMSMDKTTAQSDLLQTLAEHFFPQALERAGLGRVDESRRQWSTPLKSTETSAAMWSAKPCDPFHYRVLTAGGTTNADDSGTGELFVELPLSDEAVLAKLRAVRQLNSKEADAVRELYFAPRAALAPFALLFENFGYAVEYLVQTEDETERWRFFVRNLRLFEARRRIIIRHLAAHVNSVVVSNLPGRCTCKREAGEAHVDDTAGHEGCRCGLEGKSLSSDEALAAILLKHLVADENGATSPWENDSGSPPGDFQWEPQLFSGSAFAALLGLAGTGLHGEFRAGADSATVGTTWEEMRGGLKAFGLVKDQWNQPVPTIIPDLNLQPKSAGVREVVSFKNGFAWRNHDGRLLEGAETFTTKWTGILLIDCPGCYVFSAGKPCDEDDGRPGCESCDDDRWSVTLQRGQKKQKLLNHTGKHGDRAVPAFVSHSVQLHEGAYSVVIEYTQVDPKFTHPEAVVRERTGFEVRWEGPATGGRCNTLPFQSLITDTKSGPMGSFLESSQSAKKFLSTQYTPTIRDIRRTYQRAFKALLLARRFCLSAEVPTDWRCDGESEVEFLLRNGGTFKGTSYYRTSTTTDGVASPYIAHHAFLDFNLLPVSDPYHSPDPAVDSRAKPSPQRQAALFDTWERLYDYGRLRDQVRRLHRHPKSGIDISNALGHDHNRHARYLTSETDVAVWLMFRSATVENLASNLNDSGAADLALRYLRVDKGLKDVLLNYYVAPAPPLSDGSSPSSSAASVYHIMAASDLQDERWATRLWNSKKWAGRLADNFYSKVLEHARPSLWAADDVTLETALTILEDPNEDSTASQPQSGVQNLVRFVQYSLLGIDVNKPEQGIGCAGNRLAALQRLNDGLRQRARAALLVYLCHMDRVPLPFPGDVGGSATSPRDISDLLLQDVETRHDESTSRIQDGIVSLQRLVTRLRIGLEPRLIIAPGSKTDLDRTWDRAFASFDIWTAHARRALYAENWAVWDELRALEKTEAGKFMVRGLQRNSNTLVKPGSPIWLTAEEGSNTDGSGTVQQVTISGPNTPGLELEQAKQNHATLRSHQDSTPEALLLLAAPDNMPRPTLLSVGLTAIAATTPGGEGPAGGGIPISSGNTPSGGGGTSGGDDGGFRPRSVIIRTGHSTTADQLNAIASETFGLHIPMWIESAIRLGTQFIRVAAAGLPPAFPYDVAMDSTSSDHNQENNSSNSGTKTTSFTDCSCCSQTSQPPLIDEYYFWLAPVGLYDPADAPQDADINTSSEDDSTAPAWVTNPGPAEVDETDAQDPNTVGDESDQSVSASKTTAQLLTWRPNPALALYWARVHNGCLLTPRRSATYVTAKQLTQGEPWLQLVGRRMDSLFFTVTGDSNGVGGSASGTPPLTPPSGPLGTALGFRYDLATDAAVALPQAVSEVFSQTMPTSGPLVHFAAYPRFVFFTPGMPLAPTTPFGAALAIAGRLKDNSCFPAALDWFRTVYNPLDRDNSWALCGRRNATLSRAILRRNSSEVRVITPESSSEEHVDNDQHESGPQPQDQPQGGETTLRNRMASAALASTTRSSRDELLDSPCCPATADPDKQPQIVRSRAVLLDYVETLLRWADHVVDPNTEADHSSNGSDPGATQQALVLVETIARLLGPSPGTVIAHPSPIVEQLVTVSKFVAAAPPLNPRLLRLYDQVSDRMSRLRQRQQQLSLSERPTALPASNCLSLASSSRCLSGVDAAQPYRFTAIYPKAVELAGLVRGLATSLTSAYERGDGEYLSALRSTHERTLLELGLSTAQQHWRAADWDVDGLQHSMKAALARRQYYVALRDGGLAQGEQSHASGTETAMGSNVGGNVAEGLGQAFSLIPDLATGTAGMGPLLKTEIPIGTKMAAATGATARVANTQAAIATSQAGLSLTHAGWDRRLVEWRHQAELALIEIAQIKRQRLAAERRRAAALRDLNSHQRQREHSDEIMAFERDRNSRHALYLFLQRETAGLLRAMADMALRTAREAYAAFLFERLPTVPVTPLPSFGELWDDRGGSNSSAWGNETVHAGLLAGDRLELALRRLERSYMTLNTRELELSKRISLRESFPREFVALRQRGACEIELPEQLFDADYPGHYLRRLRSVTVSIPCVAGMYTGVHCRLQLLVSRIRTEPLIPAPQNCCCQSKKPCGAGHESCCKSHLPGQDFHVSHFDDGATDPYVVSRFGCASASSSVVATSHGQDDGGVFELSFRDERYLPFEYEGAVSRWRIELPRRHNLFDPSSLSDVVLSLNYTARDGGPSLKRLAEARLGGCAGCGKGNKRGNAGHGADHTSCGPRPSSKALWRGFEVRREFPDLWPRFEQSGSGMCDKCPRPPHHDRGHKSCCGEDSGYSSNCSSCDQSICGHYDDSDDEDGWDDHKHISVQAHDKQDHYSEHHHDGHKRRDRHSKHGHNCGQDDCALPPPKRAICPHTFEVPLRLRRGMFPYLQARKPVRITTLCISVSLDRDSCDELDIACKCAGKRCPGRHFPVTFIPPGAEHCRDEWRDVQCVEQPAVGVLGNGLEEEEDGECGGGGDVYDDIFSCEIGDLDLGPIAEEPYGSKCWGTDKTYGVVRFPFRMGRVVEVWLLCSYELVIKGCGKGRGGGGKTELKKEVRGKKLRLL